MDDIGGMPHKAALGPQENFVPETGQQETSESLHRMRNEKEFWDSLPPEDGPRRTIRRLAASFYEKRILWKPIWNRIAAMKEKRVLDYGCGTGLFSYDLARLGCEVWALDASEEQVAIAIRNAPAGICPPHFLVADAHTTGLPDGFFDAVLGNGILHHLDLGRAYAEVARLLKTSGWAYFVEPLDGHPLVNLARKLTPGARTQHEVPLSLQDVEKAQQFFRFVRHEEHFLFSVSVAPINLLSPALARCVTWIADAFDRLAFRLIPATRQYAWMTAIELRK